MTALAPRIVNRGGTDYLITETRRVEWHAAVHCHCLLGPHWHTIITAATHRELLRELATYAAHTTTKDTP